MIMVVAVDGDDFLALVDVAAAAVVVVVVVVVEVFPPSTQQHPTVSNGN